MDNETKLSPDQINSIKDALSDKSNPKDIESIMEKHLNEKQRQTVKSILSDEKKQDNANDNDYFSCADIQEI